MCSSEGAGGPAVLAALDRAHAALDELAQAAGWALTDDELTAALEAHERLASRLAAAGLGLVREADGRGLAARQGAPSTADLLRHRLRIAPGAARARVRLAAALAGELPALGAALAAGQLNPDHARLIHRTLTGLPDHLSGPVRAQAETFLVGKAAEFDPAQLARVAGHLRDVLDPDGTLADEQAAVGRRAFTLTDTGRGSFTLRGELDTEAAATVLAALDTLSVPTPAPDGGPDPRCPARRRADALVSLAELVLDSGLQPTSRGARPHVNVTAGLDTLQGRPGAPPADSAWGGPLSPETLRRIACDSSVTVIITDDAGVPLNVGRAHRTVTPGIWAALVVRDRGCAFPGCTRPPSWCQAHHNIHWADGGETSLQNCCLLCAFHHRVVHHHGWEIAFAADGRPEFIPPPWVDPERKPRRNTHWQPPDGFRPNPDEAAA